MPVPYNDIKSYKIGGSATIRGNDRWSSKGFSTLFRGHLLPLVLVDTNRDKDWAIRCRSFTLSKHMDLFIYIMDRWRRNRLHFLGLPWESHETRSYCV